METQKFACSGRRQAAKEKLWVTAVCNKAVRICCAEYCCKNGREIASKTALFLFNYGHGNAADTNQFAGLVRDPDLPDLRGTANVQRCCLTVNKPATHAFKMVRIYFQANAGIFTLIYLNVRGNAAQRFR